MSKILIRTKSGELHTFYIGSLVTDEELEEILNGIRSDLNKYEGFTSINIKGKHVVFAVDSIESVEPNE